jgi:hypothetical protein
MVFSVALIFFAAGSLTTSRLSFPLGARAGSNRVFELNIYHAVPGKAEALEERFSDASKLLVKHNLDVIGYWVPNQDPAWANTFIYIVAASSREDMEKNWDAFHADPEFQKYRTAENNEKLIQTVDSTYMRPTAYSLTK